MELKQLHRQNKDRREKINNTLDLIDEALESVVTSREEQETIVSSLLIEVGELRDIKAKLVSEIDILESDRNEKIADSKDVLTELNLQHGRLTKLISDAQKLYTEEVQKRNTLHDDLRDEERDLKERETALEIKIDAFKLERQEFNTEKRRRAASDIL